MIAKKKSLQQEQRQKLIADYLRKAQQVSILFMFDATSSMHAKIQLVKDKCAAMFQNVKGEFPMVRIKAGVVAYRDFDCGEDHTEVLGFTGNLENFKSFLASVSARGGGDTAEDVFTGIEKAGGMEWKDGTNIVLHIADAPCHGKQYYSSSLSDDHPDGDPKGRSLSSLLKRLYKERRVVKYFFSHLNNSTVKMLSEFKAAAPERDWINDDHVANDEALLEYLTDSVISSVTSSISAQSFCEDRVRAIPYEIDERPISSLPWSDMYVLHGKNYLHNICPMDELQKTLDNSGHLTQGKKYEIRIKIMDKPFSNQGACRYPFYATWVDAPSGKEKDVNVFKDRFMVVKEFKRPSTYCPWIGHIDLTTREAYEMQSEIQAVASILSKAFNSAAKKIPEAKSIKFPQVKMVELDDKSMKASGRRSKFLNMEALLVGPEGGDLDFKRFTNNAGAVSRNAHEHPYGDTVLAFSHFTYVKTTKRLMVTDLQGAYCRPPDSSEEQFTLSDPMIHSDKYFLGAPGNFGSKGIEAFFASHECNSICRALGLEHNRLDAKSSPSTSRGAPASKTEAKLDVFSSASSFHSAKSAFGSYM